MSPDFRMSIRAALARPLNPWRDAPIPRWVLVDVASQRLALIEDGAVTLDAPVSTAARGVGSEDGSFRTPPGWHRIHARIGAGAERGTVFESRIPTGRVWRAEDAAAAAGDDDLILTRILTLEGLEEGVNRGPGHDSLERFIYIHGTNHEAGLGHARSHGCVRMSAAAVDTLFDRVREGDPVVIVPDPGCLHYAGIAGSGMSALAQFDAMRARHAAAPPRLSGSDRDFDRGGSAALRAHLEDLGIVIHPQDGSGIAGDLGGVVASTAVESAVPDAAAARALGVPLLHRSDRLADHVRAYRTIAVTGTSGKSTTVAMIFEILRAAGLDPSVITGGEIVSLRERGAWGNAWAGRGEFLVIEADESDGSLVRYEPAIGVILNLERDHREMDEVLAMFETFARRTRERLVCGEDPRFAALRTAADRAPSTFGFEAGAELRAVNVDLLPGGSRFEAGGVPVWLPVPGRHNVENAVAAMAAALAAGVDPATAARALAAFRGVARRFETVGTARGVEVIDDFAHNPSKVAAAIEAARRRGRVLAIYQPHGYGPTRFLRAGFVDAFARALASEDRLWLLDIFYAGGSAVRDIHSAEIAAEIAAHGVSASYAPSREALVDAVAAEARAGDVVLLMGARDPSLSALARSILEALAAAS